MDGDPLSIMLLQAATHLPESISGLKILLTFILVLLNGFFVAAEFAIVKVRLSQIEVLKDSSKSIINAAKSILGKLDGYLAATQLGITLASLGLGWIGEAVMTGLIQKLFLVFGLDVESAAIRPWSIGVAFGIITILHIVFGELAPKSLAIRYPTSTTLAVAWPLKVFYFICRPFIFLLNGLANVILRIFGIKPIHGSEIHSEEELRMIISESHEGGAIEETERELIQNVFDFDDRRVANIFTLRKNVSALEIGTTIKEALDIAIKEGYSRYPVFEENFDNIKGILYTKDLIRQMLNKPDTSDIRPLLRKAVYISEGSKIKNVLKEFQQKHLQLALVTNEIGELTGIVTMEDILEELVGEIQDEYDNEQPVVLKNGENTYLINAHFNLSEINKYIPFKLPEGEHYETLAGLITELHENQELQEGDKLRLHQYDAIIVKMYRNSVETVELRVADGPPEDDDNQN